MSRLYDRVMARGCQPIDAAMLHRSGYTAEETREEFSVPDVEGGEPPDEATVDASIRQALVNARAARAADRLGPDDVAGATVFAADDVGHYWSGLPQGTNIGDLVESVMPPFEKMWVEFQGAPNQLGARAWGVLFDLMWPMEDDAQYPWVIRAQVVIEWTKGKPVGPVATFTVPLDEVGLMAAGDSEGGTAMAGSLPTMPGMAVVEERGWANFLGPRYLGPALFAISLMHCKNVDVVQRQQPEKVSKQHQRRTGKPLVRYWTLDIAPMRRVLEADGDLHHSGLRHALHICRGHFKTYTPDAPLFGQHTGTYWWPSFARGDRKLGEIDKDYRIQIQSQGLGQAYRSSDEHPDPAMHSVEHRDPDLAVRGLAAHAQVQNLFAAAVLASGNRPLSPRPEEPQYDLAWETPSAVWLVEVKSLTPDNEEAQLRAGLAQLLRYRQLLDAGDRAIRCVLAVEMAPADTTSDKSWVKLCDDEGITLVWPSTFERVFTSDCDA